VETKCFAIQRSHKENLFLTPYEDAKLASQWEAANPITWYASTSLTSQEQDRALYALYTQIDRGVDCWVMDRRYVPRLLISAFVFLIVYFFFSLAVRDPVPVIDELILGLGAAAATATFIAKRDKKSDLAVRRRLELKQNALHSSFTTLPLLSRLEAYLDEMAALDTLDIADQLTMTKKGELKGLKLNNDDKEVVKEIRELLLRHVELSNSRLFEWYRKIERANLKGIGDEALSARLVKVSFKREIDMSLLALMVALAKY